MITKMREIILTRVDAEERVQIRQSEQKRLARLGALMALGVAATVGLSTLAVYLTGEYFEQRDGIEFAYGWLAGIGVLGIAMTFTRLADMVRRFNPPTQEEMNELGDRII